MEMGVCRFFDGERTWHYCQVVEELSGDGYEYQFTAQRYEEEGDERDFKVYRRKRDGVLFAVPGRING